MRLLCNAASLHLPAMHTFAWFLRKFSPALVAVFFGFASLEVPSAWAQGRPTSPTPSALAKAQTKVKAQKATTKIQKRAKRDKVLVGKAFGNTPAVKALAAEMAQQHGLKAEWVQLQLAGAHLLPQVQQMIMPAAAPSAKNWAAYRARFIEPQRLEAGVQFWRSHEADLQRAEQTYGVPARYIVGILGVETYFGQHQGQFKVMDALATLSLAFPKEHRQAEERVAFFKNELGLWLKQCAQNPALKNQLGSYAGAIGWPQFMPSSIAKFAVDFDNDGRIDLSKSSADAIGSVAHYFKAYGWQTGMPTHFEVDMKAQGTALEALLAPDIVPSWSVAHLTAQQVALSDAGRTFGGPLALVELFNGNDAPSYVAGTENFFVVTRYNRSSYYALAVIELGEAIEKAR